MKENRSVQDTGNNFSLYFGIVLEDKLPNASGEYNLVAIGCTNILTICPPKTPMDSITICFVSAFSIINFIRFHIAIVETTPYFIALFFRY